MITGTVDHAVVHGALALAARAPSVHNTQPWKWQLGNAAIHLYADPERWLRATDPDGRDLLLSCGAWLHHLRVALTVADVGVTVHRLPDPDEPDLLAVVELRSGADGVDHALASDQVASIGARVSDRRQFGDWVVPVAFLARLVDRAAEQGAVLRTVTEPVDLLTLSIASRTAAVEHADTVGYEAELRRWTGPAEWSGSDEPPGVAADGVPAANVPVPGSGRVGATTRRFAGEGLLDIDPAAPDAAAVLILGTSSDDRLSRLRAGEAASAVLLQATTLGLGSSLLSEPLEVAGTRELVRDEVLGGTLSPQLVLRVGWPPATGPVPPRTPRLSLVDRVELR